MNIFDKIREVLENAEVKWVTSKPQHILELPQYQQVFGIDINTYRKLFAKEHVRVKISITQIGQIYEVLVDRDGYIIDGLSRAEAMYELYGKYLAKVLPISCTEDIVTCSVLLLVTTLSKGSSDRLAVMLVNAKRFLASLGVDVEKVIDVKIPTLSELVGNVPNKSTLIRDIYDAIEYINAVLELPRIYVDRVRKSMRTTSRVE